MKIRNPFNTLSSKLDKMFEEKKKEEKRELIQHNKIGNQIEREVRRQFEAAKEIVGYRLTMTQNHEKMYEFYFCWDNKESYYWSFYIHSSNHVIDTYWEINIHDAAYLRLSYAELVPLRKPIQTKDLKNRIVHFVNLLTTNHFGKEINV